VPKRELESYGSVRVTEPFQQKRLAKWRCFPFNQKPSIIAENGVLGFEPGLAFRLMGFDLLLHRGKEVKSGVPELLTLSRNTVSVIIDSEM
jgi:hypothetical protein